MLLFRNPFGAPPMLAPGAVAPLPPSLATPLVVDKSERHVVKDSSTFNDLFPATKTTNVAHKRFSNGDMSLKYMSILLQKSRVDGRF